MIFNTMNTVQKRLFGLSDSEYKKFNCGLIPNVSPDTVIGVRTPELHRLADELSGTPSESEFLSMLPHTYYEENNVHGFLIARMKDYERVISELERFLPYVDNWATCDLLSPGIFKKHLPQLYEKIKLWIESDRTYTVRFAVRMLMNFYLDGAFIDEHAELVVSIHSDEYYINMMRAWYFATALAKQYEAVVSYIEKQRLDIWTHNKTIQKAIESRRISDTAKQYLRTLKA